MRFKPKFFQEHSMLSHLWISRFFNAIGFGIGQFTIKWVATAFPHPAIALAYTNTSGTLSQAFGSYIVGWLSDNISPVVLMIFGNLFGALFAVGMGLLLRQFHTILFLLILVILWTAFSVTSNAASAKLISQLTKPQELTKVNSWMGSILPLRQFLASGLAGILVAAGIMHAFLAAAIAMVLSAVMLITKKKWPMTKPRRVQPRSILVGFQTILTDRILRRMVTFVSLLNFGFSFYLGDYLLYLRYTEHLSALAIGLGLTVSTIGTALALVIGPIVLKRRIAVTVMVTPAIMAIGIAGVSFWTGVVGFVVGATVIEFGSGISNQYVSLIRQRTVPIGMMGSVAGALRMFQTVLVPLGMALAGIVAELWGAGMALYMSGALVLTSLLASFPLATSVGNKFRLECYSDET